MLNLLRYFYNLLLLLVWPFLALRLALARAWSGKYRSILTIRLGLSLPPIQSSSTGGLWIHAVSVGETKAVSPLIEYWLSQDLKTRVILSHVTQTGYDEGVRLLGDRVEHLILPFDFPWIMRRLVRQIGPSWLIFVESDWWVNLAWYAKAGGSKLAIVNARMSDNSYSWYQRFNYVSGLYFGLFDRIAAQSEHQAQRFKHFLLSNSHTVVQATGNMKLSIQQRPLDTYVVDTMRRALGINTASLVIVLGSSHDPEEEILIEVLKKLQARWPNTYLILAPRHPERFEQVANVLEGLSVDFNRLSQPLHSPKRVLLIDAMGKLPEAYSISTLALVGGTWCDHVGGHNILEPVIWHVPTLYGPYIFKQKDLHEIARAFKLAVCVERDELESQMIAWLESKQKQNKWKLHAQKFTHSCKESFMTTYQLLQN